MIQPEAPITVLKGVGPSREKALLRLGIQTVSDLLAHFPRDYDDRRNCSSIRDAQPGVPVCLRAVVTGEARHVRLPSRLELSTLTVADDSGRLIVRFFNQRYTADSLHPGEDYIFFGKIDEKSRQRALYNPIVEPDTSAPFLTRRLVPLYPLTAGLAASFLLRLMAQALEAAGDQITDCLPETLRQRHQLAHAAFAQKAIHFPRSWEELNLARRRLVFEEFFLFSIGLLRMRSEQVQQAAIPFAAQPFDPFYTSLPFSLTGAQRRVIGEAAADLCSGRLMNRLVQGDVGSGKTMVAAACIWLAAKNGMQSALMAPTELLAHQHFETLSPLLAKHGISVCLLTGSMRSKEKRAALAQLADGSAQLAIGTHALLSEGVHFQRLGLVVTDEQHRFGVRHRTALAEKGDTPHILVMSATPIPRTLALMLYGDLDVSQVDEVPPGRQKVDTFLIGEHKRADLYGFLRRQIAEGRQVYLVCPAIGENEDAPGLKTVKQHAEQLRKEVFPDLAVACVHGRLPPREKEAAMAAFAQGETQILVATTVIEVGMDVPNATVMVIENAERFGLSQLHQLRGRVGRGRHKSYCFLLSPLEHEETRARLKAFCKTNDGFQIAETDLKLRGPGDFFGVRQHGLPNFRLGTLTFDLSVLQEAQEAAVRLLSSDPALSRPEHRLLAQRVQALFRQSQGSFNSY